MIPQRPPDPEPFTLAAREGRPDCAHQGVSSVSGPEGGLQAQLSLPPQPPAPSRKLTSALPRSHPLRHTSAQPAPQPPAPFALASDMFKHSGEEPSTLSCCASSNCFFAFSTSRIREFWGEKKKSLKAMQIFHVIQSCCAPSKALDLSQGPAGRLCQGASCRARQHDSREALHGQRFDQAS